MTNPTLHELVKSLQSHLDRVGTLAAHQSILLDLLEQDIETPSQEAMVFSLRACQVAEFDSRVEADSQVTEMLKMLEAQHV